MTDVLQDAMRAKSVHDNLKKWYNEGKKVGVSLKEDSKRSSTGRMFKSGKV